MLCQIQKNTKSDPQDHLKRPQEAQCDPQRGSCALKTARASRKDSEGNHSGHQEDPEGTPRLPQGHLKAHPRSSRSLRNTVGDTPERHKGNDTCASDSKQMRRSGPTARRNGASFGNMRIFENILKTKEFPYFSAVSNIKKTQKVISKSTQSDPKRPNVTPREAPVP